MACQPNGAGSDIRPLPDGRWLIDGWIHQPNGNRDVRSISPHVSRIKSVKQVVLGGKQGLPRWPQTHAMQVVVICDDQVERPIYVDLLPDEVAELISMWIDDRREFLAAATT